MGTDLHAGGIGQGNTIERFVDYRLRASWLDALPVPTAILSRCDGVLTLNGTNARWVSFDRRSSQPGELIDRLCCAAQIEDVIVGNCAAAEFPWCDGGEVDARYFRVTIGALYVDDVDEAFALVSLMDRTSEVQTENTMRLEMSGDALTGLANRAGFIEMVEQKIGTDDGSDYAVIAIDILRFSRVNECVGSMGGDELIITVARRLIATLRSGDALARTGANEFGMIVRLHAGLSDVREVGARIEQVLARPCKLSDFEIKVDCAIGGALAVDCDGDAETLMRHAQVAMKAAKISKRVELYESHSLTVARRRFSIETQLRRAIDGEKLTMAFQPLMCLTTGRVSGFEALARWDDPDMGVVPPSEFIAVAEDSGLIVPLGRWALDRALATLKQWDAAAGRTLPIYVGVNLSAIQVARDDIAALVSTALRQHKVSGYRLSIELTESALLEDADRAEKTLNALKAVDAMVAMDDFGTGFSNLASLQRLPIDTLKIDRSFVTGMLGDPDKVSIVRAVLGLAQGLGMTTTAEGIETVELVHTLAALGCTTGQGYYFAPGLGSDDALAFALRSLT
jgi:diguanylate cyclase (GGDEF)-like protein